MTSRVIYIDYEFGLVRLKFQKVVVVGSFICEAITSSDEYACMTSALSNTDLKFCRFADFSSFIEYNCIAL